MDRYAKSLRVIGQDLSLFRPEILEVRLTKDVFVVCCSSVLPDEELQQRRGMLNGQKRAGRKSRFICEAVEAQAAHHWVELRYTVEEIDRLDQARKKNRGESRKKPDIYSLSELLRTAAYADSDKDCLLKILKENQKVTSYFQDLKEGTVKIREYSLLALFRRQQAMLSSREAALGRFGLRLPT